MAVELAGNERASPDHTDPTESQLPVLELRSPGAQLLHRGHCEPGRHLKSFPALMTGGLRPKAGPAGLLPGLVLHSAGLGPTGTGNRLLPDSLCEL